MNQEQLRRMRDDDGFIAALDQSGGSTPKALRLYGLDESAWSNDADMFDLIHSMRSRMITSVAFDGARVLGAILFEMTMDRDVEGIPTAQFLWERKRIVPFLKIDKGLESEADHVQRMKPIDGLDTLLDRALDKGIFGTKMRSVILGADNSGIDAVVAQQFEVAERVRNKGLVPIIEPEVDINIPDKAEAENILLAAISERLGGITASSPVMLKLTLPESTDLYHSLIEHPGVLRVVALSGGYPREEANRRLASNHGMIASFSRALTEGLDANQSDEEFDAVLDASIAGIFEASRT
jgi:fructose-bisphosphate aldolase class I